MPAGRQGGCDENAARAVQRADRDPLRPMYGQGRGREGGAGAGHGGRRLHIQHCPNSGSEGTRPCCRTMAIVSLVSLISLVEVKWDLSASRAVRHAVRSQCIQTTPGVEGGVVARSNICICIRALLTGGGPLLGHGSSSA